MGVQLSRSRGLFCDDRPAGKVRISALFWGFSAVFQLRAFFFLEVGRMIVVEPNWGELDLVLPAVAVIKFLVGSCSAVSSIAPGSTIWSDEVRTKVNKARCHRIQWLDAKLSLSFLDFMTA